MTLIPQDSLDWLVALLRDGRAYYRHAVAHTRDAEVRTAFEIAAEARDGLLSDLRMVGSIQPSGSADEPSDPDLVPSQHRYESLRVQFDPSHPEHQAEALVPRETATMRLVESVFRSHPALVVRSLMKKHYPRLQHASAIMQRMAQRTHAA